MLSSKAPTNKWGGRSSYLYTRGAHGLLKEGAPSGMEKAAKCGSTSCHLSILQPHVNINHKQRGGRHLHQPWAATSRGRHLSKRGAPLFPHVLKSNEISIQSSANHMDLVPFDHLIYFAIKSSPNLSPFILFIFDLAVFYWIKLSFLGFWG